MKTSHEFGQIWQSQNIIILFQFWSILKKLTSMIVNFSFISFTKYNENSGTIDLDTNSQTYKRVLFWSCSTTKVINFSTFYFIKSCQMTHFEGSNLFEVVPFLASESKAGLCRLEFQTSSIISCLIFSSCMESIFDSSRQFQLELSF